MSQLTGIIMVEYDQPPSDLVGLIVCPSSFSPQLTGVGVFLREKVVAQAQSILCHPAFRFTEASVERVQSELVAIDRHSSDQDRLSSVVVVFDQKTGRLDLVSSRIALNWGALVAILPPTGCS